MLTEGVGATIVPIFLMLSVIVAAYLTTRAISKKAQKKSRGKCLAVMDRLVIGRDKHILLVQAGDTVYLLGVTGQNMTSIGTLPKEQVEQAFSTEQTPSDADASDFQSALKRVSAFSIWSGKSMQPVSRWLKKRNAANGAKEEQAHVPIGAIDDMIQAIGIRRDRIRHGTGVKGFVE